ncbi:dipeptide ABC transporter substrate-binding protein [Gracilibacillus halophilus YIM-C55.5]|uniref:Dipeptide ABC transporter substrate-binding protein n=1 Tax=Gracilibacillus halophilus YIM-C55.5 TaxID=1308866 RepID=N4WU55_9BACI|nr:ABC transporter substrate-binding protein [Gracilibacillus halophilus]ENH96641.1 dipeptide ABC transporter substrate-binding protein [Gracilibacillus halophilus YIM-C55.5]
MKKYNILLVLLIFSILVACSNKPTPETNASEPNDQLTLAIGGEPDDGFDPTTGWGRYGSPLFQSTLLKQNKDMDIGYDVATDYTVSNDGLEWTVTIRQDAKFSDGEALTIDDVIFTYQTAKKAQSVVDLTNVQSMTKMSDYKVTFTLHEPQSTFVYTLQTLGIVPEHAYDENYAENPIGSGPYQLVEWRKGEQLIVKPNPHYYGSQPAFEQLTFLFIAEDQAIAAAKAGELDVVSVPITQANQDFTGMKRVSLRSVDNRGVMLPYLEPTTNGEGEAVGHAVTSDIAIRKAMNYAVDRQAMVEGVLNGEGTVAYSTVDGLPWKNSQVTINDANQAKAEQILNEAGWSRGEDGVFKKNGQRASMTLYYPSEDQMRQSLSLVFADMMNNFGIEVTTEGASWNVIEENMHSHPVMMGWGSHNPVELYSLYHSEMQGIDYYNANYYQNSTVDQYLEQAMHAKSEEVAYQFWQKAQWDGETGMSVRGDAPWVWLVNLNHVYYINEHIDIGNQKVQPHGHGWPITDLITDWTLNE